MLHLSGLVNFISHIMIRYSVSIAGCESFPSAACFSIASIVVLTPHVMIGRFGGGGTGFSRWNLGKERSKGPMTRNLYFQ